MLPVQPILTLRAKALFASSLQESQAAPPAPFA